jgi:hypothetical protein
MFFTAAAAAIALRSSPRNPPLRIVWLVNENHFKRAMSLRNGFHLPTTILWILLRNAMAAVKKIYTIMLCP